MGLWSSRPRPRTQSPSTAQVHAHLLSARSTLHACSVPTPLNPPVQFLTQALTSKAVSKSFLSPRSQACLGCLGDRDFSACLPWGCSGRLATQQP